MNLNIYNKLVKMVSFGEAVYIIQSEFYRVRLDKHIYNFKAHIHFGII